jgi:signal peptidase I
MFVLFALVLTVTLLSGLVAYFLIRIFLYIVTIRGWSMYPTLAPGDRVLVLRHWPARWLKKGQILIGFPPSVFTNKVKDALERSFIIKRVIGLPGDTLVTFLSDLPESERASRLDQHSDDGKRVWHIPQQNVFVKGDSPGTDSLTWGAIPFSHVAGIVLLKLPRTAATTYSNTDLPDYCEDIEHEGENATSIERN